jgi:hypothetical protein
MDGCSFPAYERSIVFVAETSSDLNAERDRVCRRLEQLGYEVRPQKPFSGMLAPNESIEVAVILIPDVAAESRSAFAVKHHQFRESYWVANSLS